MPGSEPANGYGRGVPEARTGAMAFRQARRSRIMFGLRFPTGCQQPRTSEVA